MNNAEKKLLDKAWMGTSDTVRDWLTNRRDTASRGNPWAEQQLKIFLKHYRATNSGVMAHRQTVNLNEQTGLL